MILICAFEDTTIVSCSLVIGANEISLSSASLSEWILLPLVALPVTVKSFAVVRFIYPFSLTLKYSFVSAGITFADTRESPSLRVMPLTPLAARPIGRTSQ